MPITARFVIMLRIGVSNCVKLAPRMRGARAMAHSVNWVGTYGRGIVQEGTYSERNGGEFAGIAVARLNWQLKSDNRAARLFVGADCGLCLNPKWVVRSKNLH
jgi:hypothetical protein